MEKKRIQEVGTILLLLIVVGYTTFSGLNDQEEYLSFFSPDQNFKVLVLRNKSIFGGMPGQAGDNSGTVRLIDKKGYLLQEARVEMVSMIEKVEWQPHLVSIKFVADWVLP